MHRIDAPPELRVQRHDELGDREDRVASAVRIGAVRGLALDDDLERVTRCVDRAAIQRHGPPRQFGMHVCGDDRCRRERGELVAGELLGAGRVGLLARLEHGQQRRRQLLADGMCGAAQRDQGSHVDVVPAGVHRAAVRRERGAGALLDRQAVELCAHGHGALVRRSRRSRASQALSRRPSGS